MNSLTCYLAGSMRDHNEPDIEWRERFYRMLKNYVDYGYLSVVSPTAGLSFDNGLWHTHGVPWSPDFIIQHDFWYLDQANMAVFNLSALAEGYPCLGTLTEFGYSVSRSMLRYTIVPEGFLGHKNYQYDKLHPFIQRNSAAVFTEVDSCIAFLSKHIPALVGVDPRYQSRKEGDSLANVPESHFFKV